MDGIEKNVSSKPKMNTEENVPTTKKRPTTVHDIDEACQPEPNIAENNAPVTYTSALEEKSSRPTRHAYGNFLISMPSVSKKFSINLL